MAQPTDTSSSPTASLPATVTITRESVLEKELAWEREKIALERAGWERERDLLMRPFDRNASQEEGAVGIFWDFGES